MKKNEEQKGPLDFLSRREPSLVPAVVFLVCLVIACGIIILLGN